MMIPQKLALYFSLNK
uniref:Uncharacterized protein n=1 Tax=Anopheles albimanus TaxID=7167 RepID=A0A182FWY3_ANOAL